MNGQTTWSELISQPDTWENLLRRLALRQDVPSTSSTRYCCSDRARPTI